MGRQKVAPSKRIALSYYENYSRQLGYRAKKVLGFDKPEIKTRVPSDEPELSCPYARVIRKYSKPLGKLIKLPVPCGRCTWCKHHSQNALIYRLYVHAKMYKNCLFATLTYNDSHYTEDISSLRHDIVTFIKRFRKAFNDNTFTYYMVCERGDLRNRCHFHLLLFWNGPSRFCDVCQLVTDKWIGVARSCDLNLFKDDLSHIFDRTPIGFVYFENVVADDGQVSTEIMSYVSKYVSDNQKKLLFRSWSIGLGLDILSVDSDLLQKMLHHKVIQYQPKDKLYTIAVPTYYKNKIFSQSERDVMFYDYLVSDDYNHYMDILKSPTQLDSIYHAFLAYEKRCLERYKARLRIKKQKKRLL